MLNDVTHTSVTAMSANPMRRCRPQPQPDLALLREALREPLLPARPQAARLADSLRRPPSLITNPTASLSHNTPFPSPPIVFNHIPLKSSSIDTLKRISVRNASRTAPVSPSPTDSSPVVWWWSQLINERLRDDERAEPVEEEKGKKCLSSLPLSTLQSDQCRQVDSESCRILPRPPRL